MEWNGTPVLNKNVQLSSESEKWRWINVWVGRKTVNDVLQVRNAPTHFEHEQGSQTADSAPGVAT